jgi:DNA-binding GntR family transcriptional regulator
MKTDMALELVRQAILDGRYRPGEKLRQLRLAEELGLSPTPVREALRRLQTEGLVTHSPHRGVRVSRVGVPEIAEIYRILEVLEGLVARLVVESSERDATVAKLERVQTRVESRLGRGNSRDWVQINNQFEDIMHAACNSPRLQLVLKNLWDSIPRDRIGVVESMAASTTAEHRAVIDALRAADAQAAEAAMRAHVRKSSAMRIQYLLDLGHGTPADGGAQTGDAVREVARLVQPRRASRQDGRMEHAGQRHDVEHR